MSVAPTSASIDAFDAVLICTDHAAFDYALIAENAQLIVDTCNAMRAFAGVLGDRLVKA